MKYYKEGDQISACAARNQNNFPGPAHFKVNRINGCSVNAAILLISLKRSSYQYTVYKKDVYMMTIEILP